MEEVQMLKDTKHNLEKAAGMISGLLNADQGTDPVKWHNDLLAIKKFSRVISRKLVLFRKMVDVALS